MTRSKITKIVLYSISTVLFLFMVIAVHIYFVYRPTAPTAYTRIMARIDIKQPITQQDANNITSWMVHQKGIDHVKVNPDSKIVIFTFFPIKTTGNQVVDNFKHAFNLKAERFMPTAQQLQGSCPMAGSSYTYKIYKIMAKLI